MTESTHAELTHTRTHAHTHTHRVVARKACCDVENHSKSSLKHLYKKQTELSSVGDHRVRDEDDEEDDVLTEAELSL